jgi:hypothetical protein
LNETDDIIPIIIGYSKSVGAIDAIVITAEVAYISICINVFADTRSTLKKDYTPGIGKSL